MIIAIQKWTGILTTTRPGVTIPLLLRSVRNFGAPSWRVHADFLIACSEYLENQGDLGSKHACSLYKPYSEPDLKELLSGLRLGFYWGYILGLYRDNGKENGNYRNYRDYIGLIHC